MVSEREHSRLSPKELNSEFLGLYYSIPSLGTLVVNPHGKNLISLTIDNSNLGENVERRMRSDHKASFDIKLKETLAHSKTTESFREYIFNTFEFLYVLAMGSVQPGERKNELLRKLIPFKGGGIFEVGYSRDLERSVYDFEEQEQRVRADGRIPIMFEGVRELLQQPELDLEKWKDEFREVYGEEINQKRSNKSWIRKILRR